MERAYSGRDPDAARLAMLQRPQPRSGTPGNVPPLLPDGAAMRVDGSSFHLNIEALAANAVRSSALTGTVSWRHAQPESGATHFWVCGYAEPQASAVLSAASNRTNVAPELLPSTCRANR